MKQAIKSVGSQAKQAAAQTVKQIGQELWEIPKQAAAEAVGVKSPGMAKLGTENTSTVSTPAFGVPKPDSEVAQRLDYLEKELEELKKKREMEKQQEEYGLVQQQKQEEEEKQKRMQEIMEPPKKKLRMPSFGNKRPKGTGELPKKKG